MKKISARKKARKYYISSLALVILILIFGSLIGLSSNLYEAILISYGIFMGAMTVYILQKGFNPLYWKYKGYIQGAKGEEYVTESLEKYLETDTLIISDVQLPEKAGNIDHIVIGKKGVFAIETKTLKGKISYDGDQWYQKRKIGKEIKELKLKWSPSNQAKNNAINLYNFLIEHRLLSIEWVNAIVIFPNEKESEIEPKKEPENCEIFTSVQDLVRCINGKDDKIILDDKTMSDLHDSFSERSVRIKKI